MTESEKRAKKQRLLKEIVVDLLKKESKQEDKKGAATGNEVINA